MKYKILVTQIKYSSEEFDIDAKNDAEATERALEMADKTTFCSDVIEYETEIIARSA